VIVLQGVFPFKKTETGKTRLKNGRRENKNSASRMRGGHILNCSN